MSGLDILPNDCSFLRIPVSHLLTVSTTEEFWRKNVVLVIAQKR